MNVEPQAQMVHTMDQRINSTVYVVVLSEATNFPLSVSPSKEMGERTRKEKEIFSFALRGLPFPYLG